MVAFERRRLQALDDLVAAKIEQTNARDKVVTVDIGTAHAAVAVKAKPAVEHAPVIKNETLVRLELDLDLIFGAREQCVPQTDRLVELDHVGGVLPLVHDGAVTVVPAHLHKLSSLVMVREHGQRHCRCDANVLLASRVGGDEGARKNVVSFGRLRLEGLGRLKTINKHVLTTVAVVV